ncbi:MAG: hypothetical protein ACK2UW_16085 [Anaerolineales bacterium]
MKAAHRAAISVGAVISAATLLLVGMVAALAQSASSPQTAGAVNPYTNGIGDGWIVTSVDHQNTGCEPYDTSFDTFEYFYDGIPYIAETIVSNGDQIYMAERYELTGSAGPSFISLYPAQDLPFTYTDFPLPANQSVRVEMTLYQGLAELPVYRTVLSYVCNTGAYEVLSSEPLLPSQPVINILSRSGFNCSAGDINLGAYLQAQAGRSYQLETGVTDMGGQSLYQSTSVLPGATGVFTYSLDTALPPGENITATLTLRSSGGKPIYSSAARLQCDSTFIGDPVHTPRQPQLPAISLVDLAFPGCTSGIPELRVNLFTARGEAYTYRTRITQGSTVYMDVSNAAPKPPGINFWTLEAPGGFTLPASTPVQVTLELLDGNLRRLGTTSFDYTCGSGTIANVSTATYPRLYLPSLRH